MMRLLYVVFERLFSHYGPQYWWPAETNLEVIIGAILTQCTTWSNVQRAIGNLRNANALTVSGLQKLSEKELSALIYPSGYYNSKARKIKAFLHVLCSKYLGSLETMISQDTSVLREILLRTYGVGPETADSIILYAAGRPVFVIDAYTKRIFNRIGTVHANIKYDEFQQLFMRQLAPDTKLFQEYHALLVKHAKAICRAKPGCDKCPLIDLCEMALGKVCISRFLESN
jgi:endonuclease-3 related protein